MSRMKQLEEENARLRKQVYGDWRKRKVSVTEAGSKLLTLSMAGLLMGSRKKTVYVRDFGDRIVIALEPEAVS